MRSNTPLISVVVPIYNVGAFLENCLNSILSQTYRNTEIILVDDGSTDESYAIAKSYADKDSRVQLIHQPNAGLSAARNKGLHKATGVFIAFIDSDDYVDEKYLQYLYEAIARRRADIAVCDYLRVRQGDIAPVSIGKLSVVETFDGISAVKDVLSSSSELSVVTWNKLFRTSLFIDNDILFPVGKIHEDNFTTYRLVYAANKVIHIKNVLYYYTYREDSITGRGFSNKSLDKIEALNQTILWARQKKISIQKYIDAYAISIYLDIINMMVDGSVYRKDVWGDIKLQVMLMIPRLYNNAAINKKQKIAVPVLMAARWPYILLRRQYVGKISERSQDV